MLLTLPTTDTETVICEYSSDNLVLISTDPATWPEHLQKEQRIKLILKGPAEFLKEDYE